MSVDGMVPVSSRGAGYDRGMEEALQLRSSAFKPEQHDARALLSAVWKKHEPWGDPQELSSPKFSGRSVAVIVYSLKVFFRAGADHLDLLRLASVLRNGTTGARFFTI